MKRLLFITSVLLCCMPACSKSDNLPNNTKAAMKMYEMYATRQDLNVVMIGDYSKGGNTYDALMLQAITDEVWDSLLAEFGIVLLEGFDQISSLTSTQVTTSSKIDNLEELVAALSDSIMDVIQSEVKYHTTRTKKVYAEGVLVKDSSEEEANTIRDTINDNNLKKGLVSGIANSLGMHIDADIAQAAANEGKTGYVIHLESFNHTIWLFFYDSPEGYNAIMQHVEGNTTLRE